MSFSVSSFAGDASTTTTWIGGLSPAALVAARFAADAIFGSKHDGPMKVTVRNNGGVESFFEHAEVDGIIKKIEEAAGLNKKGLKDAEDKDADTSDVVVLMVKDYMHCATGDSGHAKDVMPPPVDCLKG